LRALRLCRERQVASIGDTDRSLFYNGYKGGNKVTDMLKGAEMMDHPEILKRILFPRREQAPDTPDAYNHFIQVEDGISVGCRFYPAGISSPHILFFHGNGETAPEYDGIAPYYRERNLNLFVADYRGYGMSGGSPTCSSILRDVHPIFQGFVSFVRNLGYSGGLYVMGRSLGSAPAIEAAYSYQKQLKGLVIESGFASARRQIVRLGLERLFEHIEQPVGFGNDLKIQSILIPTLIIHGEDDTIIPVSEGRALYELSGAEQKVSLFVPHAGHNDLMYRAPDDYMEAIARFTQD
jgi:alpha-beta hydrolase superfamily lysophospholipase